MKVFHIHSNAYIQLQADEGSEHYDLHGYTPLEKAQYSQISTDGMLDLVLTPHGQTYGKYFGSLSEVHRFNSAATEQMTRCLDSKTVFKVGNALEQGLFLIGCYLIMNHGLGFEETYLSFKPFHEYLRRYAPTCGGSFETWLRAFCCAKCLGWIDFRLSPQASPFHIDQFVHDDRYTPHAFDLNVSQAN